jgi:hypothetical protein
MLLDAFLGYEADTDSGCHANVHPVTSLNSVPTPACAVATGAAA